MNKKKANIINIFSFSFYQPFTFSILYIYININIYMISFFLRSSTISIIIFIKKIRNRGTFNIT